MFRSSLFQPHTLDAFFDKLREKMYGEINRIPAEEIVRADVEQLSTELME